jgi:hypothetical protein
MEKDNLLILLHYYTFTFGWTIILLLGFIVVVFLARKYKPSLRLLLRGSLLLLLAAFIENLLGNQVWAKAIMEIFFLFMVFVAIYYYSKNNNKI